MSKRRRNNRTRHPLQSLFLFLVVCSIGYFGWQNRHLVMGSNAQHLTSEQRTAMRGKIIAEFEKNPDFVTVRSISWRPREQRYRLDIELEDECLSPRDICDDIATFVNEDSEMTVSAMPARTVVREIGRAVPIQ